ncbi:MAG TPA: TlpA disulfide reductase family protein [Saprospiraceae bacterium]|nr:TlpA disulfide reductase family protein [Saprospiraceae bacterium]
MQRKWIKRILKGLGIVFLLFVAWILFLTFRPVRLQQLMLTTLTGESVALDSLLSGRYTILNFWATWCKPCIEEMPMLDSVYQALDKDKWQLFLISDEPLEKINAFKAKVPYTMPFVKLDASNSDIGISALPKTLVIDENLKVLYSKTGGLTMGAGEFLVMVEGYE